MPSKCSKRNHLIQRKNSVPEKRKRQHHQQQPVKPGLQEHPRKKQRTGNRPETNKPNPLASPIPQMPPKAWCYDLCELNGRHQGGNLKIGKALLLKVQRPIGQKPAQEGEKPEVEVRKAPVDFGISQKHG